MWRAGPAPAFKILQPTPMGNSSCAVLLRSCWCRSYRWACKPASSNGWQMRVSQCPILFPHTVNGDCDFATIVYLQNAQNETGNSKMLLPKTGQFFNPQPPSSTKERSLGWCALRAPPFTRTVAPPPGPLARVDPGAGKRSARPGAPPTARPVTVGGRSSLEQHHPCQGNQGVRTAPSRVWSMATPCHRQ